jgi:hypothetical protein
MGPDTTGLLPVKHRVRFRTVLSNLLHCPPSRVTSKLSVRAFGKVHALSVVGHQVELTALCT